VIVSGSVNEKAAIDDRRKALDGGFRAG